MAQQTNDFISDNNGGIFKQAYSKTVRQSIIKSNNLEFGQPRKIHSRIQNTAHKHDGNIFPLIEGDEIVGFVYECACGEVAKILFEYGQNVDRAAS